MKAILKTLSGSKRPQKKPPVTKRLDAVCADSGTDTPKGLEPTLLSVPNTLVSERPQDLTREQQPTSAIIAQYTSSTGHVAASPSHNALDLGSHMSSPVFFPNATKFTLDTFQFQDNTTHLHLYAAESAGWQRLLNHISTSALYNSSDRFDPPKCDEDTRVEVIDEIMAWIQDPNPSTRWLCMTGAAGSGKSALQQTIAERCADANLLASAHFFKATDPIRNNYFHFVPTVAYQLGLKSPPLKAAISRAVENDPSVFQLSLKTQLEKLVVAPFGHLRSMSESGIVALPHAILIDGLDECLAQGLDADTLQSDFLRVLSEVILDKDLPFKIFLSSRPEWEVRTALEPHGCLDGVVYHIQLSDQYEATDDIRRTLTRRLCEIGRRSGDPRARSTSWPSEDDIESLVRAASGQYIYAATVIRYVSDRRSSPVERLRTVLEWTPRPGQKANPFSALDTLYSRVLSTAKEAYESVDTNDGNFLVLFNAYRRHMGVYLDTIHIWLARPFSQDALDRLLGLEPGSSELILSDLQSLMKIEVEVKGDHSYPKLRFYHKTFHEFLLNEVRAGDLYVKEEEATQFLIQAAFKLILSPRAGTNRRDPDLRIWCMHNLPTQLRSYLYRQRNLSDCKEFFQFHIAGGWDALAKWILLGGEVKGLAGKHARLNWMYLAREYSSVDKAADPAILDKIRLVESAVRQINGNK